MELRLTSEQESALTRLAAETGRHVEDLVHEAVDWMLAHDRWFRGQVEIGIAQLDRGEFVSHEEVRARLRRIFLSGCDEADADLEAGRFTTHTDATLPDLAAELKREARARGPLPKTCDPDPAS